MRFWNELRENRTRAKRLQPVMNSHPNYVFVLEFLHQFDFAQSSSVDSISRFGSRSNFDLKLQTRLFT